MKNSKRMLAVVAASGLVLGGLPGVANAQSEGLLDLNLGVNVGDSVEVGVNLGLGSLGVGPGELNPEDFPALTASVGDLEGAGSDELAAGSEDADFGDIIEEAIGAGSSEGGEGSSGSSEEEGPGGEGSSGSSEEEGPGGEGSSGSSEESGGTGGLSSDSLGEPGEGSSEGSNGDSEEPGGTDDPSIFDRIAEWFSELFDGGSSEGGEGSSGSSEEPGAGGEGSSGSGEGSNGTEETPVPDPELPGDEGGLSSEIDAELLLTVGSLAAAGIAIGIAANGGIDLPPLPGIDVGLVCELPQEGIDFLKGNGSMQPDECLPEEQN